MARNMLTVAAVLLAAGLALGSPDAALLSLIPLFAYSLNAWMEPPKIAVFKRRVGSQVEIIIESDRKPGIIYIYEAAPINAPVRPLRRRVFKPPFRRILKIQYYMAEKSQPLPLVAESYNPAFTKRRTAVYTEEPRLDASPEPRGPGVEEFLEVRPYQPGDPVKLINWKAFAKTGELYVNTRIGPETRSAVVVVDARRLRSLVIAEAVRAAEILSEKGYDVVYYVLGHGLAPSLPRSFTPSCEGSPPCGDVTVYVGSLADVCLILKCKPAYYIDVAGVNSLVAVKRLKLYRELRAAGAEVLRGAEELRRAV
ncbi:hypothetical protein PAE2038 [Pyrobaculum aerophilum str. IM2]|uniref:DUF58 domain-containing protein n=2 Tax=Pyrobaculum aerophilum TaxID=13773 RepID=Q8ZW04_PYRAE|nr:DUF58 domain-containing protein [Pyrobaculum aerophilum]AAL63900.1 hypothetical protein PAE2038 [Pyrobaculum aerophilum str. IM2]